MAIYDVDKNLGDRSSPMPNTHDVMHGLLPLHGTESTTFIASPIQSVLSTLTGGHGGGGSISQGSNPTVLPPRANPPSQPLAFGQAVVGGTSSINWVTIPHKLSFTPVVTGYLLNSTLTLGDGTVVTNNASIPLPVVLDVDINNKVSTGVIFQSYVWITADAANVYIFLYNGLTPSSRSATVTYYCYQQIAS